MRRKTIIVAVMWGTLFYSQLFAVELKNVAEFGAGFATGIVWHEFSHAVAVVATGGTVDQFNFSSVYYHYDEGLSVDQYNSRIRVTSLAGYVGQGLASEVILQHEKLHSNDFALGWLFLGVLNNLHNPIRYFLFDDPEMDLGFYEAAGGNPVIPSLFMVAHSSYILYRLFSKTDIPLYITHNTLGLQFDF